MVLTVSARPLPLSTPHSPFLSSPVDTRSFLLFQLLPTDCVHDVRQWLLDIPDCSHFTCYYIEFDGERCAVKMAQCSAHTLTREYRGFMNDQVSISVRYEQHLQNRS